MQETQCPQCGEWLGVPPEFADRPVKCGACGRVIQPHERTAAPYSSPPPPAAPRTGPRFPDNDPPASRGPRFPDNEDDRSYAPPRRKGGGMWWLWLMLGVGAFGLCCCGGVGALFLANANKWESYTPENGAFTAEFPGKPVAQTRPFKWKDGKEGTAHEYAVVHPFTGQVFVVTYTDLPKSLKGVLSDEAIFKYGLEDIKAKYTNLTVQATTELPVGKSKAMDVEGNYTDPQHGMLQVSARSIIVGDRLFILIAAGKDKKKLTPLKDRFFNSFKPADPKDKDKPADPKEP